MRISDWSSDVCSSDLLFQAEFLDARFVGSDRRAFHADAIFLDRVRGIDGDLVVGAVALLDTKVVIMKVDVEIGKDQPLTDPLPDDPGHFVAVEFDDRVGRSEEHTCELQSLMRISYAGVD